MSSQLRENAPVTWLASYPRSGNTLLRVILKRCFGQVSQSIYDDAEFSDPDLCNMVGHEAVGSDPQQFLQQALREGRRLYVKTHGLPPADHHPVIYVLRDGRSAVVSHFHFLREMLQRDDITLADVIGGKTGISWSRHVDAWTRPGRRRALVVRFEKLAAGDSDTLAAIADFTGMAQQRAFDISFGQLQALDPAFFRRGSDRANLQELDGDTDRLFERLHGDTLRAAGYGGRQETMRAVSSDGQVSLSER